MRIRSRLLKGSWDRRRVFLVGRAAPRATGRAQPQNGAHGVTRPTLVVGVHPTVSSVSVKSSRERTFVHLDQCASHRRSERGSAVFIVLVLLAFMVVLAVGNNVTLGHLRQELRLLERRQLERSGAIVATNRPVQSLEISPDLQPSTEANTQEVP